MLYALLVKEGFYIRGDLLSEYGPEDLLMLFFSSHLSLSLDV